MEGEDKHITVDNINLGSQVLERMMRGSHLANPRIQSPRSSQET